MGDKPAISALLLLIKFLEKPKLESLNKKKEVQFHLNWKWFTNKQLIANEGIGDNIIGSSGRNLGWSKNFGHRLCWLWICIII